MQGEDAGAGGAARRGPWLCAGGGCCVRSAGAVPWLGRAARCPITMSSILAHHLRSLCSMLSFIDFLCGACSTRDKEKLSIFRIFFCYH